MASPTDRLPGLSDASGAAPAAGEARLIPRQVLFGNPDRAHPQLSPDGRHLAWLAPVDGVLNVWVAPTGDVAAGRPVTRDTHRGIRNYFWAWTSAHIVFAQDVGGDENWHIYCADLDGGAIRDLTPLDGIAAMVNAVSPLAPYEIVVAINDRDPQLHDYYRIDLRTGERAILLENPGFIGVALDRAYRVRFGVTFRSDGGYDYLEPSEGSWKVFLSVPQEDTLTTRVIDFDDSGDVAWFCDSRGRDTAALVAIDTRHHTTEVLAESQTADLESILVHPTEQRVQAAFFTHARTGWVILDEDIRADLHALEAVSGGELEVLSRTDDDRTWVVSFVEDAGPIRYYLWDRPSQTARFLFTNRAALEGLPLAPMQSAVIAARDGMLLVVYLTLPLGGDGVPQPRPPAPLPTVLLVHGGPWARDRWGYNPYHQLLANRGYAVLSVNYRGSTGFGKAFINAANRQWGRTMQDDLLDAVAWAVGEGVSDARRVAIMGGSYGGYATLAGVTLTPEAFTCGVDIVGPSNLITFMETIPPYWMPMIQQLKDRVGDKDTEEGRAMLIDRSPLTHVDRIQRPLLIGQGANDPRIKQSESDQIVSAMQAKSIPVTYVLFPDEGHGFARPENSLAFQAITEAFLARHLGGRMEPVGADLSASSARVVIGADEIPGLGQA